MNFALIDPCLSENLGFSSISLNDLNIEFGGNVISSSLISIHKANVVTFTREGISDASADFTSAYDYDLLSHCGYPKCRGS